MRHYFEVSFGEPETEVKAGFRLCLLPTANGYFARVKRKYKNGAMNKRDLVKAVAARGELRAADASKAMEAFENILADSMARGEKFSWPGVGIFFVREYKARLGRSPFTGLKVQIPARKVVKFSPGKCLREAAMKK